MFDHHEFKFDHHHEGRDKGYPPTGSMARLAFYRMVSRGTIAKTEQGYMTVERSVERSLRLAEKAHLN
jgi:hypothetical protein